MFKTVRWRSEKNKIKAVFKLQFQTSQVPPLGWDTLMVSLVPLEVGKPTVKSENALVQDGTCRWEKPIFETLRFVREPKTRKINERVYRFVVSTGSSKACVVGEVTFDFADYAETSKTTTLSLPLKMSNSDMVLHITIQRIQASSDGSSFLFREAEENGDVMARSDGRILKCQLSSYVMDGRCEASNSTSLSNSTEGPSLPQENILRQEKASLATQAELSSFNTETFFNHAESVNILREPTCSDAISVLSLDSSSRQDNSQELGLKINNIQQDLASDQSSLYSNSTPLQKGEAATSITDIGECCMSNMELLMNSANDGKLSNRTIGSEDTILKERLQGSDVSTEKLKNEMVVLARQAEVSKLELQTLRKKIVKESRRGQELSKEIVILKEQRDTLKRECEQLKSSQLSFDSMKTYSGDQMQALEEIRKELDYEKILNADLMLQLRKTQASNSELTHAIQDLEWLLEQRKKETTTEPTMYGGTQEVKFGASSPHLLWIGSNKEVWNISSKHGMEDEEQQELEELAREHGETRVSYSLEEKIIDLCTEIDMYKKDREELEMQMEQIALDYEILKQENHSMSSKLKQSQVEEQLKMQYECSGTLAIINDLEIQVKNLEKEQEKQAEAFEADLKAITHAKIEQEQRAIRAEETLKKIKWKNAKTAERLQKEFKALSMQVSSMFSAKENLVMQTSTEASKLRLEKSNLQELVEKADEELALVHEFYKSKVKELASEIDLERKQTDQLLLKLKEKSKDLENQKKCTEEKDEAVLKEILMLQIHMETLRLENRNLSEQVKQKEKLRAEMEHMKTSFEAVIVLLQTANMERIELERKVASMSKEEEKSSLKEVNDMMCLMGEKGNVFGSLQSEPAVFQALHYDLKHFLLEEESEKEKIRKKACHLQSFLQNKDDVITIVGGQLKENTAICKLADGSVEATSRNIKSGTAPHGLEVSSLTEKIKLLEGEINQKEMALEKLTLSFLRKEDGLCNRIDEVEKAIGELNQE